MPNFDGGHYFLTALLPIGGPDIEDVAGPSLAHRVREALSVLPKARQTPSSVGTGRECDLSSPFARSPRTHFAGFVVIDDVVFNGREAVNALRVATDRDRLNPTVHGPYDQLSCPYLLFSADFDAENGTDEKLRSYLVGLWDVMEPELRSVLRHCRDFARVRDANGFADCVIQGQIETTMPFNDYWAEGAPFLPKPEAQPTSGRKPFPWRSLALIAGAVVVTIVLLAGADALFGPRSWWSAPVKALVGLAAAVLVLALLSGPLLEWFGVKLSLARLLALALAIVGFAMIYLAVQTSVAFDGRPQPPPGILNGLISIAAGVGVVGLAVAAVLVAFRAFMMRRGATPFPKAPDSDLPSILKALYLQQRFQDFAITAQGKGDAALHAAFKDFLDEHKPGDPKPTQEPGTVRA